MLEHFISLGMLTMSWYGPGFDGRLTASGQVFNQNQYTCAHKYLPFGTKLLITNKHNKSLTVTVTDRGPFVYGRDLDLSKAAFKTLFSLSSGVTRAQVLKYRKQ